MKWLILMIMAALIAPGSSIHAQENWIEHTIANPWSSPFCLYAYDVDEDNDVDVLCAGSYLVWFENDGSTSPNFPDVHLIGPGTEVAYSVDVKDIDDDSDGDIFCAYPWENKISVWINELEGVFIEYIVDDAFGAPRSVCAEDLDGDHDIDVLGAAADDDQIAWWEYDGTENFTKHIIDSTFDGAWSVYAEDLDGDNDMDVLGAGGAEDAICWWENDGATPPNFTEHIIDDAFDGARSVYAEDLDGDDDMDVLGAANLADAVCWWENDGATPPNFIKHVIDTTFDNARSVCAEDVDGDDDMDILAAANLADAVCWWKNDGATPPNFTKHVIDSTLDGAWSVYVKDLDLNGDNKIDVLAGSTGDPDVVNWYENDLGIVYDVGVVSIDIPSIVPEDTIFNPLATVKNMGTSAVHIPVTCEIEPGGYANTQSVLNIAPGDSTQVIFDDLFTFASGPYTVTVYTWFYGDVNPANDTLEKIIETHNPGVAEGISDTPVVFTFSVPTISRNKVNIELALSVATKVDIVIYDAVGRLSEALISKKFSAGTHSIPVSLDLPTGVYFYNLKTASGENVIKKFLLVE